MAELTEEDITLKNKIAERITFFALIVVCHNPSLQRNSKLTDKY